MTEAEFIECIAACPEGVGGHPFRDVRTRMQEIADSSYAEYKTDHYGNGGFVSVFEAELAELLGKESAVFMPSGTMAQQIALRIWADRAGNRTVAFHPTCHLELHEHMGYQELHHLDAVLLGEPDRLFTLEDLEAVDRPISSLLVEFPQREIGGQLPTWLEFSKIASYAKSKGIKLHLDGARLWECGPYFQSSYSEICEPFDSVYVSFYKLLAGLPGAALAGPKDFIDEARIWMRRHGGNLVHMFPNAISAKIGMDRHLPRVPEYVAKAAEIASILCEIPGVTVLQKHPPTNMIHVTFSVPRDRLIDAVGRIAKREKCLLLQHFKATEGGTMTEFNIGEPALQIPAERIQALFAEALTSGSDCPSHAVRRTVASDVSRALRVLEVTVATASSVTAPTLVRNVPLLTVPLLTVIDTAARITPLKTEFTPRVADDPTDQ